VQPDLILFHPDFNRRLRSCTGSADPALSFEEKQALAGLGLPLYRRWGVSPRPENECRTIRRNRNMTAHAAAQERKKKARHGAGLTRDVS